MARDFIKIMSGRWQFVRKSGGVFSQLPVFTSTMCLVRS